MTSYADRFTTDEENIAFARYIQALKDKTPGTGSILQCEQQGCTTMIEVFVLSPFGGSVGARCQEHGWDVTVRMDNTNPLGIGVAPKEVPAA